MAADDSHQPENASDSAAASGTDTASVTAADSTPSPLIPDPPPPTPEPTTEPIVVVDDVHVVYRVWGAKKPSRLGLRRRDTDEPEMEHKQVHALRGVSLVAHRGEAIGLIGGNGSGKSTLSKVIAGLLPPTSGAVYCNAEPTLLGVNAALMKGLTGERNVVLGLLAMGFSPDEVDEMYDGIVDFSGIGDFINLPMNAYSSGMGARLRFAIGSSVNPEVLIIDEALATGDRDFKERSGERVKELRQSAGTVFLVHHSMKMIRNTCTRAVWMQKGQIVMDGPVDYVAEQYERLTTRAPRGKAQG